MKVKDARDRKAIQMARGVVGRHVVELLFGGTVTALMLWAAADGVDGVPAAAMWLLAGVFASRLLEVLRAAVAAVGELRRVRRCAACRAALLARENADDDPHQCRPVRK